jgi:hypothetical protein
VFRRRLAVLALISGLLVRAAWGQPSDAPARVTDVAVQSVDDTVTVSIATEGAPKYRSELLDGPFRLVFDFENTLYDWKKAPVSVATDPVKEIRGSQYRVGVARIVIELRRRAPYRVEPEGGGIRVVFAPPTKAAPPTVTAPPVTAPATAPEPAPSTWRLQGIIVSDGVAAAYIVDPATNQVGRYAVGDRIGDGRVEAIEERRVVLRMPRGGLELRLDELLPAPRPEQ